MSLWNRIKETLSNFKRFNQLINRKDISFMRVVINPTKVAEMPQPYPVFLGLSEGPRHHLGWWWFSVDSFDRLNLLDLFLDDDDRLFNPIVELYGGAESRLHGHDLERSNLNRFKVVEFKFGFRGDVSFAGAELYLFFEDLNFVLVLVNVVEIVLSLFVPGFIRLNTEIDFCHIFL